MIIGDMLIELKTTKVLDAAKVRDALLQLIGYALLKYDDRNSIRSLGGYFARQEYLAEWPIWLFLFPSDKQLAWSR